MTSYSFERFDFLPGAIVFGDEAHRQWRVCVPEQHGVDAGLGPDALAALGADNERIVGRVVCRLEDGTPAVAALYLDVEGGLHWGKPFPAPEAVTVHGWPPPPLGRGGMT